MTLILLLVVTVGFLVAFSRSGTPRDQRIPWNEMDLGDLLRQAMDGVARFAELNSRRR